VTRLGHFAFDLQADLTQCLTDTITDAAVLLDALFGLAGSEPASGTGANDVLLTMRLL